jgi:hypothetical protein
MSDTATTTDEDLGFEIVDAGSIPATVRQNGKAAKRLRAFTDQASPGQAGRINVPDGTKAESVAGGLKTQAHRLRAPVKVYTRNGSVWLERLADEAAESYWADVEAKAAERAANKAAKATA